MTTTKFDTAALWMTDKVVDLFCAEIANERNGGISPATLESTIDSISQAPDILCPEWTADDFVALLMVIALVGIDTELVTLLRAHDRMIGAMK